MERLYFFFGMYKCWKKGKLLTFKEHYYAKGTEQIVEHTNDIGINAKNTELRISRFQFWTIELQLSPEAKYLENFTKE